ncbi:UDP-N-acetylglucosamine 2-epimerase (non-hydrolyzing) [Parabacteroides sp.]|uniref:non-hydrolyzing UDP-N-acetylglucosamine 2-epimerase n=1 Tax=Parabacteroides sp. TaxID=1869337 RepID=UPI002580798E|nr:UDP-N-acetylglucosamine 2-epimerase (non-hydrolyzing) [Parabacteroides sp.]
MDNCIMQVVGNRPQFIKLASVSREIRTRGYKEIIIHSGQHFDENMSDIFFRELDIPQPDRNLHISGGSHAEMTARIMIAIEKVILEYIPQIVIVYGDTNTTLAVALVVKKLNIPLVHIEAGPRTGNMNNPEEVNRVIIDHISDLLCTPDKSSFQNLIREGLEENAFFTGDVMYDIFVQSMKSIGQKEILKKYSVEKDKYILMTWHRQENTADRDTIQQIIELVELIDETIVCPLHPRTRNALRQFGLWNRINAVRNLHIVEPVGYLEMITLVSNCRMTLTDSGGLSKESFFAGVKCLFMANLHVWPELEESGWIYHMSKKNSFNIDFIHKAFKNNKVDSMQPNFYGDGNAAEIIVNEIEKRFNLKGCR